MPEMILSETEVREMMTTLSSIEMKLNDGINRRKQIIEKEPENLLLPVIQWEIKKLRKASIGVQAALLNLEAWVYEKQ